MDKTTTGTVVSVQKQWWLKVNTKPARAHALDGAAFPHIITVEYTVDGKKYKRRRWLDAGAAVPALHSQVTVRYEDGRPDKGRVLESCSEKRK